MTGRIPRIIGKAEGVIGSDRDEMRWGHHGKPTFCHLRLEKTGDVGESTKSDLSLARKLAAIIERDQKQHAYRERCRSPMKTPKHFHAGTPAGTGRRIGAESVTHDPGQWTDKDDQKERRHSKSEQEDVEHDAAE